MTIPIWALAIGILAAFGLGFLAGLFVFGTARRGEDWSDDRRG